MLALRFADTLLWKGCARCPKLPSTILEVRVRGKSRRTRGRQCRGEETTRGRIMKEEHVFVGDGVGKRREEGGGRRAGMEEGRTYREV